MIKTRTKHTEIMDEVIEEIVERAKLKVARFPIEDQALIWQELSSRMEDLNMDTLHNVYLLDNV